MKIFLVGLGGIGMSALAQLLRHQGHEVAGSDRDLSTPAQVELFTKLAKKGIRAYPQDGSGIRDFAPERLIYSTAIENDNPDFAAAPETPKIHRAAALAEAIAASGLPQIAVAGSCGKTSVTGWIGSCLSALGKDPCVINGGYGRDFISDTLPGNFRPGSGCIVFEADESDGSLVTFSPEVALLLNIGDDHYDEAKLKQLFSTFLGRARRGVAVNALLAELTPAGVPVVRFVEEPEGAASGEALRALELKHGPSGLEFRLENGPQIKTQQWGRHSASNALAVLAALQAFGIAPEQAAGALFAFTGVRRRFEAKGLRGQVRIYDDYAHNPQKIAAIVRTGQEISPAKAIFVFQPHGFKPLRDMREPLLRELKACLRPEDRFFFLPVFYAGGTTSFQPSADEVVAEYAAAGLPVELLKTRADLEPVLDAERAAKVCIVLGARDPSLIDWTDALGKQKLVSEMTVYDKNSAMLTKFGDILTANPEASSEFISLVKFDMAVKNGGVMCYLDMGFDGYEKIGEFAKREKSNDLLQVFTALDKIIKKHKGDIDAIGEHEDEKLDDLTNRYYEIQDAITELVFSRFCQ